MTTPSAPSAPAGAGLINPFAGPRLALLGPLDGGQLDGYGWVLDAAWLLTRQGERLYSETWRAMAGFADTVASRWREPDAGIWEVRDDVSHHVHSKLMAWLALDREAPSWRE